jgi:3'(2'), 5'-bisphosphate nucleotidase
MRREAEVALAAAREASALILQVYSGAFDVEYKAKDDPVTIADKRANALLVERLTAAFPGVPVVAEESDPASYAAYRGAPEAWFVDPLDGTREFVARNGEFAVMLGLAEKGRATVGVVVAPAWGRAFVGVVGEGAWEVAADGSTKPIHVTARAQIAGASVVVSRSRAPARVQAFVATMGAAPPVPHGSSGLKGVLVATGVHDVYMQPGRAGMRWDACATEALVVAAGGKCTEMDGAPLDYANDEIENARGLLATNGLLHAAVVEALLKDRASRAG